MATPSHGQLLVLTTGSPYAAVALAPLLLTRRTSVAGIGLSARPGPGRWAVVQRVARRAGWRYAAARLWGLALLASLAAAERLAGTKPTARRFWTFGELARAAQLPVYPVHDVNSPAFAALLRAIGAPALVSVLFDQVLAPPTLALPALGCYNLHPSLLPRHRGTAPVFWAMACGDAEVGVTLHAMTVVVDAGPIIAQRAARLHPGDALSAAYLRCCRLGARLLVALADQLTTGTPPPAQPQPTAGVSFHGSPTRAAVQQFLARGYRLV